MNATFKILIVEDSAALRCAYQRALGSEYTLFFAERPLDALTLMIQQRPDVVVLDLSATSISRTGDASSRRSARRLDGIDLCRMIKRSALGDTPVLLCTSRSGPFDQLRARRAGADRSLAKPVSAQSIYQEIRDILSPRIISARLRAGAFQWTRGSVRERAIMASA